MAAKIPKGSVDHCESHGCVVFGDTLKKWECEIHFASSCTEANTFVGNKIYDLVLREFRLSDGSS